MCTCISLSFPEQLCLRAHSMSACDPDACANEHRPCKRAHTHAQTDKQPTLASTASTGSGGGLRSCCTPSGGLSSSIMDWSVRVLRGCALRGDASQLSTSPWGCPGPCTLPKLTPSCSSTCISPVELRLLLPVSFPSLAPCPSPPLPPHPSALPAVASASPSAGEVPPDAPGAALQLLRLLGGRLMGPRKLLLRRTLLRLLLPAPAVPGRHALNAATKSAGRTYACTHACGKIAQHCLLPGCTGTVFFVSAMPARRVRAGHRPKAAPSGRKRASRGSPARVRLNEQAGSRGRNPCKRQSDGGACECQGLNATAVHACWGLNATAVRVCRGMHADGSARVYKGLCATAVHVCIGPCMQWPDSGARVHRGLHAMA